MRTINHVYQDPVDIIWLHAARELGIQVMRDAEVFAAWDGNSTLRIGTPETLDPDDSLAQMIFHEICHWLIEGPESFSEEDWGLDYDRPEHAVREHACLRLQAALADRFGLRTFFASTTDFRDYFDSLPADPLADPEDPAAVLATEGLQRALSSDIATVLDHALRKTREIANVIQGLAPENSLWRTGST